MLIWSSPNLTNPFIQYALSAPEEVGGSVEVFQDLQFLLSRPAVVNLHKVCQAFSILGLLVEWRKVVKRSNLNHWLQQKMESHVHVSIV